MTEESSAVSESGAAQIVSKPKPDSGVAKKSTLEVLASSAALTALITVFGTAIVGTLISGVVQDRSKRNEIALTAFKENQTARTAVVTELCALVGNYVAASDDLITITDAYYDLSHYEPAEKKKLEIWQGSIRQKHDEADSQWRGRKYSLGYLLAYHHYGKQEVSEKWNELVHSVDDFDECARGWLIAKGAGSSPIKPRPCLNLRLKVESGMLDLTRSLDADRRYLWQ